MNTFKYPYKLPSIVKQSNFQIKKIHANIPKGLPYVIGTIHKIIPKIWTTLHICIGIKFIFGITVWNRLRKLSILDL